MSRVVANKKYQPYNNMVLCTILTKGNIFRDINKITGNRVKQILHRIEGGAAVGDGETVAGLFNEYFTTIAGNKLEQYDQT